MQLLKFLLPTMACFCTCFMSCNNDKSKQTNPSSIGPSGFDPIDSNFIPSSNYIKNLTLRKTSGCEFYTEKNYQGFKYVIEGWGDYPVEGLRPKSVKLLPGYKVSFDFESDCNSVENGNFRYIGQSIPDINAMFGCDESFSKITEVYLRKWFDGDEKYIEVFSKPYLLGEFERLAVPKDSGAIKLFPRKNLKFPVFSLQVPKGYLINLFSDERFLKLESQLSTAESQTEYPYIIGLSRLNFLEIKSLSITKLK